MEQSKNDVTIRSLLDEDQKQTVPVERLRAYHGEYDKAVELSRMEQDEHAIKEITHYYGNPMDRGTLGFQVEFEDGTMVEKTFNDIKRTVALNNFIRNNKELLPLTAETLKAQAQLKKQIKQGNILEKYRNAKEVYIDVRCRAIFPYEWYARHFESLPDANTHVYLIKATATGKRTNRNIMVTLEADKTFLCRPKQVPLDNWDFNTYVYTQDELNSDNCTVLKAPPVHEKSNLIADGIYHRKIRCPEHVGNDKMTVVLLNVCSLRAAWRKGLLDYLVATPHDVLVLTETRLPATNWPETKQAFHDLGYRTVDRTTTKMEGNAAGILIATTLSKAHGEMGVIEQAIDTHCDGRVLELALQFPPITIVGAYLPCHNTEVQGRSDYAPKYMKCFASKYVHALKGARDRGREYILCGDLQVAMTDLDQTENAVAEGSGSTTAECQALQELFTDSTYTDFYRMCNPTTQDIT